MSGRPGTFFQCKRYPRMLADQRALRIATSGPVLRARLERMTLAVLGDVGRGFGPNLLGISETAPTQTAKMNNGTRLVPE